MTSQILIPWVNQQDPLPEAAEALQQPAALAGLVTAGKDLSVHRLIEAYGKGIYPWYSAGQPVLWWSPSPRMVLQTHQFRLHHSFKKTLKRFINQSNCEIRFDTQFEKVIQHCAQQPRHGQHGTWIVPEMIQAYCQLHEAGVAHSVETWVDQRLVAGLYCINLGSGVFGESMFSLQTDGSKIALAALVAFAKAHHMPWIDCQQNTRHLASLGAQEMARETFIEWVKAGCCQTAPDWVFQPIYWNHLFSDSSPP